MVRVVSCHHFVSQDVFLSEHEPVAYCSAQDKLLVATTQHAVNVHDLDSRGKILHTFTTIDLVTQIIYCEAGNYVATMEKKTTRHSNAITYVRIYFNWWIDGRGQPLRVRIAGCKHTLDEGHLPWNNHLEMVELPLQESAINCIACCKKHSTLAVSLEMSISVFFYTSKFQDDTCQKFGDFEHLLDIKMYFVVKELNICENYFACLSNNIVQVLKVIVEKDENLTNVTSDTFGLETMTNDFELYDKNFIEWKFESCTENGTSDISWEKHLKSRLHPSSFPITISLPTIDRENQKFSSSEACELYGPLLAVKGCTINVKFNPKVFEMFPSLSSNVKAVTLLYKQFSAKSGGCDLMKIQLIPFYSFEESLEGLADPLSCAAFASDKVSFSLPWLNLSGDMASNLRAIGCFFTTCQEGFLYDISCSTKLITKYAYTAVLKAVVLEMTLLHALTETGLETYTMHLPHSALKHIENVDDIKNIVPNFEDAVCLLGLRPFLGVDHLAISDNHIILVSSTEDSVANIDSSENNSCTLYSLKKPQPSQMFADLLEMGEIHQGSSPTTYYHLLSEGHMILRTHLLLNNKSQDTDVNVLYKKSCLLIADYSICSDSGDKLNCVPYYHLSELPPDSIIQRISDFQSKVKHSSISKALVHYLNSLLFDESIYTISQHCAEIVLAAYSEEAPEMLWKVILCSKLSDYKYDRAILMLKRRMTSKRHPLSPISNAADTLALVSLLLIKGNMDAAQSMLLSLTKADLVTVLRSVNDILWANLNMTNLGEFIKQARPDAIVELLLTMVDNNSMKVSDVILMLQNDAPNSDLHNVPLLKEFLEASLTDKKLLADSDSSALTLLVKIYLKHLLEFNDKKASSTSPFAGNVCAFTLLFGSRPTWLNELPPFNGNGISRSCLLNSKDVNKINNVNKDFSSCCCWTCNEDLLKLQSLLSYLGPSDNIKEQVLEFVHSRETRNPNWISLEAMCFSEAQAVKMLVHSAPQAVLPYAKANFAVHQKKWCMLFQLLHEYVKNLSADHPNSKIYTQTFNGVLNYLSETLKPAEFLSLLPQGENPAFLPHVQRCVEKHQADQLRNKIVSLGQEIKSMMY